MSSSPAQQAGSGGQSGRKRGRDTATSPLSRLLDQLKRLRVPSIGPEEANALLGPLVLDCLGGCNDSSLADILASFGWQGGGFTTTVNLFGLSTALSKYRWVRVQVRRPLGVKDCSRRRDRGRGGGGQGGGEGGATAGV